MSNRRRLREASSVALIGLAAVAQSACVSTDALDAGKASSEEMSELVLDPIAALGPGAGKEISGIVRSRRDAGVFWTLNDSGDEPRVYPVRIDGSVVPSVRYPDVPGTLVGGAINCDWEDIALDASGRLIIADFGNNSNARADLALYFVEEPEITEGRTAATSKVIFKYPDQTTRPAPRDNFNFDAEAIYTVADDVFILTKHRSDSFTTLYHLDERTPGVVNVVARLGQFDIRGQATGADASADGLMLVVLTYDRIWLFERKSLSQSFFRGTVHSRLYRMPDGRSDSEAICFENEESLLIADESRGRLYRVDLDVIRAQQNP